MVRVTDEGFRPHAVSAGAPQPDYEGVAYEPAQARVWIADEATQQIRAFACSGQPTGDSLCIPTTVSAVAIRPNRGFEALTFSPTDSLLWTAPEEPPRADPPSVGAAGSPSPATGGVIELLGFSPSGALQRRVPYAIDPSAPSGTVRAHLNGVPALCALPDGSLLVLERELLIPRRYLGSWCAVRLFRVSAQDLAAAETSTRTPVSKQLLTRWITRLRCSGQLRRTLSGASVVRRPPNAAVRERCAGWGRALVPAYARRLARHRLAIGCRRGRCPMSERTGQGR